MIRANPNGNWPKIHQSAYIDPTAVVIGKVKIGKNVLVAPGAVIRADEQNSLIEIADNCNVQDRVIIHALRNSSVVIGKGTSLSHGCIIHGPCHIGKDCFIGFGSVVFKAEIADAVFVKFMAVVCGVDISKGKVVPEGAVINCWDKVKSLGSASKELEEFKQNVIKVNLELVKGYKKITA
ncbi:MAG: carbonate dehydratase [Candidatus Omnitrophica bacterium]|nr:carbonate dehydratase [Candidatus Omnitrophota bacterium]